jgi:hypothetical protein
VAPDRGRSQGRAVTETEPVNELLIKHARWLHTVIREQDNLSRPCADGYWRLAGKSPVPLPGGLAAPPGQAWRHRAANDRDAG